MRNQFISSFIPFYSSFPQQHVKGNNTCLHLHFLSSTIDIADVPNVHLWSCREFITSLSLVVASITVGGIDSFWKGW